MQQKTASIAGSGSMIKRNYGAPTTYQPTFLDKAVAKVAAFATNLFKKLIIVFGGVLLDHGSKYLFSKTDEKTRSMLSGKSEEDREHDRSKIYGNNNYENRYDRYDSYTKYDRYSNNGFPPGLAN